MKMQKQAWTNQLSGQTVLFTGGGGGIGFAAVKAFAGMGASVILAEIDQEKGKEAEALLKKNYPNNRIVFYAIDLADDTQIYAMYEWVNREFGLIDVLFHNACITPIGNVEEISIETWEKSYRVNFRAPLLLTQLFLPEMKRENRGTIVFVPSSGAAPYMGAYEVFKTAQVELCNTLAGELSATAIDTYAIGPGLVKTQTAMDSIEQVARRMGISTEEFYRMNESHLLSVEEAGWGFALSVLNAKKYNGQEIGSIQVLLDGGFWEKEQGKKNGQRDLTMLIPQVQKIITIYQEQYAGWKERNIFERQWVLRDFKKTVGMSAEQFSDDMYRLEAEIQQGDGRRIGEYQDHFSRLKVYFERQNQLLHGFEKNPEKLKELEKTIREWLNSLTDVLDQLK